MFKIFFYFIAIFFTSISYAQNIYGPKSFAEILSTNFPSKNKPDPISSIQNLEHVIFFDQSMSYYLSLGEMESCYLMQLALNHLGHAAEVLDYTKIGITASQQHGGHITHIDPSYILRSLEKGVSAIIPGFQGVFQDQLAILSRGASDETAIAIAASLQLQCEIHSDVSHIYNEDRTPLSKIDYDTLYAMITHDQKPMSKRSIILAQKHNLSLRFRHWSSISGGTLITKQPSEEINSVS